jgi:tetraacyldisaccharide 4'-kinase
MILLKLLSKIYLFVINIINFYYDKFPPKSLGFPVICVGGIRAGGSGKTPLTDWVIGKITEAGKTPVLFSRGYKRISKKTEVIPSYCETTWETVGDEPMMLKNHRKNLWLAIDKNRHKAAKKLCKEFSLAKSNIVGIMDDGFQHRKFPRNLDIVILTETDLTDDILPFGRLREPVKSLERADVIVTTQKIDNPKNCVVKFVSDGFVNVLSKFKQTKFDGDIFAFCGIARPERFFKNVESITKKPCKKLSFPDHYRYKNKDYKMLNSATEATFVTTEKDFVRFDTKKTVFDEKLWSLSYRISIEAENEEFLSRKILEICRSKR